jgi:16S rRNA (cytosine967-C5)-methyltransferase
MNPRVASARALADVMSRGRTLDSALPAQLATLPDARDKALAQEISYGVLRWYFRLDYIAGLLLERPLSGRDADVRALLLGGIYQAAYTRVPAHAAVSETVHASRLLDKAWAAALLNAVLRRFLREQQQLEKMADDFPPARHAHPQWLLDALRRDWPDDWPQIIHANNSAPPLHLRVNLAAASREDRLAELSAAGLGGIAIPFAASGIRLERPVPVGCIPGFDLGLVSVQDAGAQLAAFLLDAAPGDRVLDACAAPGGKTAHLLEIARGRIELVAVDCDEDRLLLVRDNLARTSMSALVLQADARRPGDWWDGRPFDRILIDAPCSATGVIRRHPDIKLLRKPGQVDRYAKTQSALLRALWPLLRRGGRLLYATCSLLHPENDAVIGKFIDNHEDVRTLPVNGPWGSAAEHGRHTVPGRDDADGFYYSLLEKT